MPSVEIRSPSRARDPEPVRPAAWSTVVAAGLLVAAVAVVYGQALRFDFVYFDDDRYVVENPLVREGLRPDAVVQAFTGLWFHNWQPLALVSHMLDCELFGLEPGWHHLASLLLHAVNAVLVLVLMEALGERPAVAALIAGVFALHPLRVESVAWIAERKDVLAACFFLAAVIVHVRSVRTRPAWAITACTCLMALGLMAKPMVVTLPCVLLLLDWWPLRRLVSSPGRDHPVSVTRAVLEKAPLVVLSAAGSVVAMVSQQAAAASLETLPLGSRLANAAVAVCDYVVMAFVPVGLAAWYPWSADRLTAGRVIASGLLLVAITAGAIVGRHRQPRVLVGWLWFVGMLVPVLGIVQVGGQALADRFTYLPQIGLTWAVVGLVSDIWAASTEAPTGRRPSRAAAWIVAGGLLAALAVGSWAQVAHWRNAETLWTRVLACTTRNSTAHLNYGIALRKAGRLDDALVQFESARRLEPDAVDVLNHLGMTLSMTGGLADAARCLARAHELDPSDVDVLVNLGINLARSGRDDQALQAFGDAMQLDPLATGPRYNAAVLLEKVGRCDDARRRLVEVLDRDPHHQAALQALARLPR